MSTEQGILGNNMLAYCQSNPITFKDHTGTRIDFVRLDGGAPVGFLSPSAANENRRSGEKAGNTAKQVIKDTKPVTIYNGKLVIKIPGDSSFSFGVIFMGRDGDEDLLKHEYGHTKQLEELGVFDYCTKVVIPSAVFFWSTELLGLPDENYYSYPWEYQADQYGGVKRKYTDWAEDYSNYYWNIVS